MNPLAGLHKHVMHIYTSKGSCLTRFVLMTWQLSEEGVWETTSTSKYNKPQQWHLGISIILLLFETLCQKELFNTQKMLTECKNWSNQIQQHL